MLGWWRVAVFCFFAFAAVATPTPDPFGMTLLALALSALYFAAVGAAFLNDRRRRRRAAAAPAVADDEYAPLEPDLEPIPALEPVAIEPAHSVAAPSWPRPARAEANHDATEHRYDDLT
jgi:sec-independent protein translocase protein TatC